MTWLGMAWLVLTNFGMQNSFLVSELLESSLLVAFGILFLENLKYGKFWSKISKIQKITLLNIFHSSHILTSFSTFENEKQKNYNFTPQLYKMTKILLFYIEFAKIILFTYRREINRNLLLKWIQSRK